MSESPTDNSQAAMLAAQSLSASYAGSSLPDVLSDINVELAPGELVALIGPNGSGKSSLIRALSRTLRPHAGSVLLDGSDLYASTTARTAAKVVGVVPQDTAIAFEFSVREVVAMGRAPHQPQFAFGGGESPADTAAIDEAMVKADIRNEFASRPVSTLSGGERQRVLIARALAQDATVLLLDEPTASLDIRHETEILTLLRSLAHDEGRAILIALHDLNLAAAFADRVMVMKGGTIRASGAPDAALTRELIADVYGVDVWIGQHPHSGRPYFLTMSLPTPMV